MINIDVNDESMSLLERRSTREQRSAARATSSQNGKTWKSWSECSSKERWVIVAKIALAIFLIAALATACAFTGMAAGAMIAGLVVASSSSSFAWTGAVLGASIGLGIGGVVSPFLAIRYKMHKYNASKNNVNIFKYLASSLGITALSAGVCGGTCAGTCVGFGEAAKAISSIKIDFGNFRPSKIDLSTQNPNIPIDTRTAQDAIRDAASRLPPPPPPPSG